MAPSGSGTGTPITAPANITRTRPDDSGTLLALDDFRRLMGLNPLHFYQLENQSFPARDSCSPTLFNYAWQNVDAVGRMEIVEAIRSAEDKLTRELGFAPAPMFRRDVVAFPAFYDIRQQRGGADASGDWPGLRLQSGRVQSLGVEHLAYISEAPLTFVDQDGDGFAETFTLSVATTETDPRAIACYFVVADRFDDVSTRRRWQVAPISVSISGGIATIRGRTWTVVRPVLYERYEPQTLDPAIAGNFVSRLQVWARSVYTGDQGVLIWETVPGAACSDEADPSGYTSANARFAVRAARIGYVAGGSADYNATAASWQASAWPVNYLPTHAAVNYYGGFPAPDGDYMAADMKQMIARLAVAELARPICGCNDENREFMRWQFDISKISGGPDELFQISQQDLDGCEWGTRRGHVVVWRQAQRLKRRYGISTG